MIALKNKVERLQKEYYRQTKWTCRSFCHTASLQGYHSLADPMKGLTQCIENSSQDFLRHLTSNTWWGIFF